MGGGDGDGDGNDGSPFAALMASKKQASGDGVEQEQSEAAEGAEAAEAGRDEAEIELDD